MISNEFDMADSDNKDVIKSCPLPIQCIAGLPRCQVCCDNAWVEFLSQHPTPESAFDFDRPGGHAAARAKVAKVVL